MFSLFRQGPEIGRIQCVLTTSRPWRKKCHFWRPGGSSHPYQIWILAAVTFLPHSHVQGLAMAGSSLQLAPLERQTILRTSLSWHAGQVATRFAFSELFEIKDWAIHVAAKKNSSCPFHFSSIYKGECERKRFHRLTSFTTVVQRSRVWIGSSLLVLPFDAIADFLRSSRLQSYNSLVGEQQNTLLLSPSLKCSFFPFPDPANYVTLSQFAFRSYRSHARLSSLVFTAKTLLIFFSPRNVSSQKENRREHLPRR